MKVDSCSECRILTVRNSNRRVNKTLLNACETMKIFLFITTSNKQALYLILHNKMIISGVFLTSFFFKPYSVYINIISKMWNISNLLL